MATSRESVDLAMDTDLEARLESAGDDGTLAEKGEPTKKTEPAPHRPATLAPDDPENPRNWSVRKKIIVDIILCVWVLSLTYSSTAYVASIPALVREFHSSLEVSLLGVSLTVFGLAAGPLIFGPASEVFGRRVVYLIAGLGYSAFSIGVAFAQNTGGILALRFLVGFFGSGSINNVPASIGDFTTLQERLGYSSIYALMAFGGPSLGPLLSAFIQTEAGFRWNLRVIAIFSTVTSILVALLPETHGPTLLKWRLQRENKHDAPSMNFGRTFEVMKLSILRPVIYLFTEPVVMLVSVYLSVLYGILYGFFEAFTVVYLQIRGMSEESHGLTYISLGLGFLASSLTLATFGQKLYLKAAARDIARGIPIQPEARLSLGYYGAILCPISLFIFAWTAPFPHVHWIAPCIGEFLFSASILFIFTGFIPFLIDCYQMTAASALAAGMASRSLVGGAFPLFTLKMYHALTVQGATSLLAGVACCLAPIPFIFKLYGTRLRERSRHAVAQSS
ncbi:MFS transporter [Mycena kentingensis (nom. inval.)]|nr:MFS transporter [Mycena kentingensis (nom. inval.)]